MFLPKNVFNKDNYYLMKIQASTEAKFIVRFIVKMYLRIVLHLLISNFICTSLLYSVRQRKFPIQPEEVCCRFNIIFVNIIQRYDLKCFFCLP